MQRSQSQLLFGLSGQAADCFLLQSNNAAMPLLLLLILLGRPRRQAQ